MIVTAYELFNRNPVLDFAMICSPLSFKNSRFETKPANFRTGPFTLIYYSVRLDAQMGAVPIKLIVNSDL